MTKMDRKYLKLSLAIAFKLLAVAILAREKIEAFVYAGF